MTDEPQPQRHPLEPPPELPVVDEGDGYWLSPGAARKFRRRAWAVAALIALLGVSGLVAWDARDTAVTARDAAVSARDEGRAEVLHRIRQNTESNLQNCMKLNKVAEAAKAVVNGTGASLTQEDVSRVTDPEIRALLQAIVDRSAANQQHLKELGEQIPVTDCEAQARRAGGPTTLPTSTSTTTTAGSG